MSSNNNTNNSYRGPMGSGLTSGAGDHVGTRDNTHDGYGGSNTFSDARGLETTNSESFGRSTGLDPRMSHAGMGSGTGTTHSQLRSEQVNATTNRPYGQPSGSGYYDPSRLNTSASSATGGMPGSDSELRGAAAATGPNSGRGIHAEPYYHQGQTSSGLPTSASGTGVGMSAGTTAGMSGHHSGHHTSHQDHSHHHETTTDKRHCTMCHMVDERAREIDSMGKTTTTTSGTTGMGQNTGANTMSGTGMPPSGSLVTDLGRDATTVTREGPSYMHLKPGETVVEHETRVHRGLAPGEKIHESGTGTKHTGMAGMASSGMATKGTGAGMTGMGSSAEGNIGKTAMGSSGIPSTGVGSAGMAASAAGMGHGVPMGSSAGLASGMGGAGAGAKGPSMTDKVVGGAEKIAGKVTSNEEMLRRGEEKLAGTTASSKN